MGYEDARRSESSVGVIAVIVALLIIVGLVVLGAGTLFVVRMQTVARVEHDHALMARQAQLQMERQRALAEMEESKVARQEAAAAAKKTQLESRRKVTITLDEHGNISADGKPLVLDDLKSQLQAIGEASDAAPSVVIQADDRCLFQHVSSVLSVCQEAGVDDIDIAPLPRAEGDDSSAAEITADRAARESPRSGAMSRQARLGELGESGYGHDDVRFPSW